MKEGKNERQKKIYKFVLLVVLSKRKTGTTKVSPIPK